jgi:hypothetical protein
MSSAAVSGRATRSINLRRLLPALGAAAALALSALAAAMVGYLALIGELRGGLHTGRVFPVTDSRLLHLLVNHVTVNGLSRSGDTLAPVVLALLAVALAVRRRGWSPVLRAGAGFVLLFVVLALGKVIIGTSSTMSGPATCTAMAGAVVVWLLWPALTASARAAMAAFATSYLLAVAATQLYTGHRLAEVLLSVVAGGFVAVLVTRGAR